MYIAAYDNSNSRVGLYGYNTTEAGNNGYISVRGKNNQIRDYNVVRYCPFCAKEIKVIK